mgnify:CR=1 FL=1
MRKILVREENNLANNLDDQSCIPGHAEVLLELIHGRKSPIKFEISRIAVKMVCGQSSSIEISIT